MVCNFLVELSKELDDDDDGRGMAERIGSIRDFNGRGLLHYAASRGRINVCKYAVEELNLPLEEKDTEGNIIFFTLVTIVSCLR